MLYSRLRELEEAGLVRQRDADWELSRLGADLGGSLAPLDAWARRWADTTDQHRER